MKNDISLNSPLNKIKDQLTHIDKNKNIQKDSISEKATVIDKVMR
jgi:hypothetical protein